MKTDFFTKFILTVIAACLIWICIKPFAVPSAQAGPKELVNVNIAQVGGRAVYKALPVEVQK